MKLWEQRFRASVVSLPQWARDAPDRCLYRSNAGGRFELYAWERSTGTHRQVTHRSNGTRLGALDPAGEQVWWFADTDGDEFGEWMCQPYGGGPDTPAVPGLSPSYPAGLDIGTTVSAVGLSSNDGVSIHLVRGGAEPMVVYMHSQDARVVGLCRDETLLCIGHSEHGDATKPALRVLTSDGGTILADLWDGDGLGLEGVSFSPVRGDNRLLALHERTGRRMPLLWDPITGTEERCALNLPGEVSASWYPDGVALLIAHRHGAQSELYRYDLALRALVPLGTPPGTVAEATARPDGSVEMAWSSAAEPSQLRDANGSRVLRPPSLRAPRSVPLWEVRTAGPGGDVPALLTCPEGRRRPYPAVFLLHGGPAHHDTDSYAPDRAAWVDAGFAVVHVNYRGSTGYGSSWEDALKGRPGLTELEDIAAVRARLVADGMLDARRLVLAGTSWGGYLTLLGLGTQPDDWAIGIAAVPVADYLSSYEEEMEALRAFDRAIFGGSPAEVPERYRASSPLTYVRQVCAPLLVTAGANDPRCPIRQIENYVGSLASLGKPYEVYRYDAGHGSLVTEERIQQMRVQLDFARRHLPAPQP